MKSAGIAATIWPMARTMTSLARARRSMTRAWVTTAPASSTSGPLAAAAAAASSSVGARPASASVTNDRFTVAMPSSAARGTSGVIVMLIVWPPACAEPDGLGAGREPGTLDDDAGAGRTERHVEAADGLDRRAAERRVERVGEGQVLHVVLEERVGAAPGAVDELVRHDEGARGVVGVQAADGTRGHDRADAERTERPDVRAVVDAVRGDGVLTAVAGQERDPLVRPSCRC